MLKNRSDLGLWPGWRPSVLPRALATARPDFTRSLSNPSTSRNESEYRRYQSTAQRISSGSVLSPLEDRRSDCLFHDLFSLPAPSAKVATQPIDEVYEAFPEQAHKAIKKRDANKCLP